MSSALWMLFAVAQAAEPAAEASSASDDGGSNAPDASGSDAGGARSDAEDAMFGGTPTTDAPASDAPTSVPLPIPEVPTLPGAGVVPTDADIGAAFAKADDRFVIGGRMYLRTNVTVPEVEDLAGDDVRVSSPNLLDLYMDARPNERVRAYTSARLNHDWSVLSGDTTLFGTEASVSRVSLDQMWVKFDLDQKVYVTAGRQRVKWGAGRFWNPTDVLNRQRLDSLAFFDERTGVSLVRVHVPLESVGANLYAVADLEGTNAAWTPDTAGSIRADGPGAALRAEWAFRYGEVSATASARPSGATVLGADASVGVGWFDLKVEGAVQRGGGAHDWEGTFDLATFTLPTRVDRDEDWIPQVVAGVEVPIRLNDEDSLNLGVEGFWNDAGYDDAELYTWLLAQGEFQSFYLGRAYVAGYAFVSGPGSWNDTTFTTSFLSNLSDESRTARLDVSTRALTYLNLNVYAQYSFGENGEFHYAVDIPAIPGVLDEAVSVPANRVLTGVGASVKF